MSKGAKLEDVNSVIDSLYEVLSPEVRSRGLTSDRKIIELLAANTRVHEALSFQPHELKQNKDLPLAKQLLAQGTQEIFRKQYNEALVYINTASRFLPQIDTLLCGLHQLRSTVLLQLKRYEECAVDLEKALEKGAPDKLHHKLYDKLAGCYSIMKKYDLAKEKYTLALASLSHAAIPDDKKRTLEEHFLKGIQTCEKEIKNPSGSENHTGAACFEVKYDDINARIQAMNLDVKGSANPVYPQLRDCCKVVHLEGKGRGVVATRDIRPGEILLSETCHSAVLFSDHWTQNCWWCLQKIQSAVPCPSCTSSVFCSDECLNKALQGFHSPECGMMALLHAVSQGSETVLCLFALRVLTSTPPGVVMSKVKDETESQPITNGESLKALDSSDPVSMYDFICNMPQDETLDGLRLGLYSLLLATYLLPEGEAKDNVVQLATLLSQHQRALNITNKAVSYTLIMRGARLFYHSVRIGRALWPTLSLLNHSCDPVADTILNNHKTVVLRSKCSIRAGEEITISYVGHYSREDRENRQGTLKEGWGFTCTCRACAGDWSQYMRSDNPPTDVVMRCQHCQHRLLKVSSLSKVANQEMVCPSCNTSQNPIRASEKIQELDIWREKLRCKLLSELDPTDLYQEVMTSQEKLDHMTEKPNLFHARMNEMVHHLFLLMSDRQIVTKIEGGKK